MAIDTATDLADILAAGDLPAIAGTYAQGANTKAMTGQVRHRSGRANPDRRALELDGARVIFSAVDFASGFSGSSPVRPTTGDTFTISAESVWTVALVEGLGAGAGFALTFTRRTQKGAS
jgi:hypothetical protein